MAQIGVFFSTEELSGPRILELAPQAEQIGFEKAWISDHFHPWNDEQGESPFVWSVLGGLAAVTSTLKFHTGVTCPMIRTHPVIIAQAAATVATLMPGRFGLGVGTGEALNEHIFGDPWPNAEIRREMLEEAVEVIRLMWTGATSSFDGHHYHVENARIYSLPDELPPLHVSAFGPRAVSMAARIADGFMTVGPEAEFLEQYRSEGGTGTSHTALKVCVGPDEEHCIDEAYRLWPNAGLPGELAQILPTVRHFEQATELVTRDMIAESTPTGPDAGPVIEAIAEHVEAGYDEVYVAQIGQDWPFFYEMMERDVLPHFGR
ncbi:MAG: Dehydrogenase [uncultured Solirubrobacteraceae bacterium]|uniref:Dehydrogenase n=1 Tax=uncultured Solirubrobacteraceae bacterium TaxID=1162706 RepID=A0A6J4RVU5_9ACTN|nr:MAG: Dehydrogenase [uncultured Solirubrobacteraceae bacterium]